MFSGLGFSEEKPALPHLPALGYHPYPVRSPRYRIQGKTLKMEHG